MTEIGSRQDLDEAMAAFQDNPNSHNQSVLERAMRLYQCNVTAVIYRCEACHDEGCPSDVDCPVTRPDMAAERAWREGNR